MTNYQMNFKRYEKKYLMDRSVYFEFIRKVTPYLKEDEHCKYTIGNIYYDTDNYDLIRASIEKPLYKEKLRLRSYGAAKKEQSVYLELKKKFDGIVYKRRSKMTVAEAEKMIRSKTNRLEDDQIRREIRWFAMRYNVSAKVYLGYDRTAYCGKDDAGLRITVDENIRFRTKDLDLSKGNYGTSLIGKDKFLVEIKSPEAVPLWLSKALSELGIFPTSFSKYGECYKHHLIAEMDNNGGRKYA